MMHECACSVNVHNFEYMNVFSVTLVISLTIDIVHLKDRHVSKTNFIIWLSNIHPPLKFGILEFCTTVERFYFYSSI